MKQVLVDARMLEAMKVRGALIAVVLLCAGQAKAQEDEVQTRAVAQFRRGMEAMRPCERLIDVPSRYFKCRQEATWGTTTGNTSVPQAYLLGAQHEEFLHEARNNDIHALITSGLINDKLKKLKGITATGYCIFFKVDCREFSKYWLMMKARYPRSQEAWMQVN